MVGFQLRDYVEYMGSAARVVLVPSVRDASHDFVYPQVKISISVVILFGVISDVHY